MRLLLIRNGYNLRRKNFYQNIVNKTIPSVTVIRFKTMKYLNVAEKNDAAKNIALHLSRGTSRRREGMSQYNKIYEFEADVLGQKCQMLMTSVSGHLLALEFVGIYKRWQSCSPLSLFDAPVFKYCPENYEKIKKTLEREVRSCDGLIIWTDCDREGENIGFEIIEVCTAAKRNLRVYRAKFSEITGVSVKRALANLEQPNKNISDAVDVRQELDLRIGAAFTRFQTLRLQKVFPTLLAGSLVSYGSCQFPTLGFVVERYRAVENFITEPFWKIKVNHTLNNLSVDFSWDRVRLFDRDACLALHDVCTEAPRATVTEVRTKPKSKWRPLPLDTVELEKLASRKLKINAKETMKIAEKLYTQGFISYPRTETNEYPKEMDLGQLVGLQTGDPNWGPFAQGIMDSGGPTPRQGNKSDKAHPPIHPTKYTNSLSGNEQRVYEFIVRSFLACCSKDAVGQETTVAILIAGEKFSASGLMITARNYLEVYPYDKWSSKEIHVYETGQTFDPTSIDMVDGSTSPPNLLTEADLIGLMEKHGIGTDATHAEHIETIKSRSYVSLHDAHFVPGRLGMGLVEGYDAMGLALARPELRAGLEADLRGICDGNKDPRIVLAEQVAKYKEVYITVAAEAIKIDQALAERLSERPNEYTPSATDNVLNDLQTVMKCPKCGSDMAVTQRKNNADEYYITCLSFPNCKNAVWFPSIVKTCQVLPETCSTCGPNYKKIKFEWRNNSISHLYPPPYIACIGGCDTTFLELMKIRLSSVRQVPENTRTQNTNQSSINNQNSGTNSVNRQNVGSNSGNRQNSSANSGARQNNATNSGNRQNSSSNSGNRQNNPTNSINRQNNTTNSGNGQNNTTNSGNWQNNTTNSGNWQNNANTNSAMPSRVQGSQSRQFQPPASVNRGQNASNQALPIPGAGDDNNVVCRCNNQAIMLTVRKQNANFGKKFYKCAVGKENGGCDFFLWAPESEANDTPPTSNNSWGDVQSTNNYNNSANNYNNSANNYSNSANNYNNSANSSRGWGLTPPMSRDSFQGNDDGVNCNCGIPCKKLTVHKEGPNKGRQFYGCSKEYNARCNFFQWGDDSGSSTTTEWGSSSSSNYRGRGRGRGRSNQSEDGNSRTRKCGICRQEGHTRARCPNNNNA